MATAGKNLSQYDPDQLPDASDMKIGIAVSKWNNEITDALCDGAVEVLKAAGIKEENLIIRPTPGSFELPLASQRLLKIDGCDAAIAIGSVIQGETRHFEFVCQAVAQGVKDVSLKFDKPVIFCVLTDDTIDQARARSGGAHGNKGVEAAVAVLEMLQFNI